MAPPYVFAVFRHEGEHATTLWIFVNYNTSNAADLQHQNEYSVQALSSNMSSKLCLDTILSLTLPGYPDNRVPRGTGYPGRIPGYPGYKISTTPGYPGTRTRVLSPGTRTRTRYPGMHTY